MPVSSEQMQECYFSTKLINLLFYPDIWEWILCQCSNPVGRTHMSHNPTPIQTVSLLLLFYFWLCGSQQTGKFSKRWEYQTTLPASWETCMQVKKPTVRTRHGTTTVFKIGKGIRESCILSPYLFNLNAEYIRRNARLGQSQTRIKLYQLPYIYRWYHPNGRKQRGTKMSLGNGGRGEW